MGPLESEESIFRKHAPSCGFLRSGKEQTPCDCAAQSAHPWHDAPKSSDARKDTQTALKEWRDSQAELANGFRHWLNSYGAVTLSALRNVAPDAVADFRDLRGLADAMDAKQDAFIKSHAVPVNQNPYGG